MAYFTYTAEGVRDWESAEEIETIERKVEIRVWVQSGHLEARVRTVSEAWMRTMYGCGSCMKRVRASRISFSDWNSFERRSGSILRINSFTI
jgi:hypothetical protein